MKNHTIFLKTYDQKIFIGFVFLGDRDKKQHLPPPKQQAAENETRNSLAILLVIFLASLGAMVYVYLKFPALEESEKEHVKVPFDIEDAKLLAKVLDRYKDLYYFEVMTGIVLTYIL